LTHQHFTLPFRSAAHGLIVIVMTAMSCLRAIGAQNADQKPAA